MVHQGLSDGVLNMADFVYLKSSKVYVRVTDVSQVKPVFDGQITKSYDLTVDGNTVSADAEIDGATIHNDILGIPQTIQNP